MLRDGLIGWRERAVGRARKMTSPVTLARHLERVAIAPRLSDFL
jgi:hypothetical protein